MSTPIGVTPLGSIKANDIRFYRGMEKDSILRTIGSHYIGENSAAMVKAIDASNYAIVDSINDKYAVIVAYRYSMFANNRAFIDIFLVGYNDEGAYFIKCVNSWIVDAFYNNFATSMRLQTHELAMYREGNIETLISHVNRGELGYERIQGDVLCRFGRVIDKRCELCDRDFKFVEFDGDYQKAETLAQQIERQIRTDNHHHYLKSSIGNNHFIKPGNGLVLQLSSNAMNPLFLVTGESFSLIHPEHKQVDVKIPKDHIAVLTLQQGMLPLTDTAPAPRPSGD